MAFDPKILHQQLQDMLVAIPNVAAIWEGGSVATGFSDQYSDLDLLIVTHANDPEPVFVALETFLDSGYGIQRQFRMPEPSWHGLSQCFYLLKDSPPCYYLDLAVTHKANPNKLTEPDRHGNANVWYDPGQIYTSHPTAPEELAKIQQRVFKFTTDIDFITRIELEKAVLRENWIASQMNYYMFVNRCLVPLLNLKYRPAKADFGIRYSDRDYPLDAVQELSDLLRITSVEDIKNRLHTLFNLYDRCKEELTPVYGGQS